MKRVEQQIHIAVAQHLRTRAVPGMVWFHVPNGGLRTKREAALLKAMGVRSGVADLILFHGGKLYALEIKAPGGRATEAQLQFLSDIDRAGAFTALPVGLDAALATLESWGLIRPAIKTVGEVLERQTARV
jgi:hypothetical protein